MSVPVYKICRPLSPQEGVLIGPYNHWAIMIGEAVFEMHGDGFSGTSSTLEAFEGQFKGLSHRVILGHVEGPADQAVLRAQAAATKISKDVVYAPLSTNCLWFAENLAYEMGVNATWVDKPQTLIDVHSEATARALAQYASEAVTNKSTIFISTKNDLTDRNGLVCSVFGLSCVDAPGLRSVFESARIVPLTDADGRAQIKENLTTELGRLHDIMCIKFPALATLPIDINQAANYLMSQENLDAGFSKFVDSLFRDVAALKAAFTANIPVDLNGNQEAVMNNLGGLVAAGSLLDHADVKHAIRKFGELAPTLYSYKILSQVQSESEFFDSTIDPALKTVNERFVRYRADVAANPSNTADIVAAALFDINSELDAALKLVSLKIGIIEFVVVNILPGVVLVAAWCVSGPLFLVLIPFVYIYRKCITHLPVLARLQDLSWHIDNVDSMRTMLRRQIVPVNGIPADRLLPPVDRLLPPVDRLLPPVDRLLPPILPSVVAPPIDQLNPIKLLPIL